MISSPERRQRFLFSVLFLMGSNLLFGCSYRARQDSWISMLIAIVSLLFIALMLSRISRLHPNKDVFDLLSLGPRWIAAVFECLVSASCFGQAVLILKTYSGFAQIVSLHRTHPIVVILLIAGFALFFCKRDSALLFRFSYVAALPILFLILLVFFMLLPMFRGELLLPIAYQNTEAIALCAAENFSFPFGNITLLLGILSAKNGTGASGRLWISVAAVAGGLSLLILMQDLLLLGGDLSAALNFPYNFSTSLINVADFFSRLEVFTSLFFFLSAIVRCAFFLKTALRGFERLTKVSSRAIAVPFVSLAAAYALVAFSDIDSVFRYLELFPYVALPLQVALPIYLYILCNRAEKRNRKSAFLRLESPKKKM